MLQTKLKLNKIILVILGFFIGFLGYYFYNLYLVKEHFYKVVQVIDGDTIKVKIGTKIETVRLLGIDTPEISDSKEKTCYGGEAKRKTKEILENKFVYLIPEPLVTEPCESGAKVKRSAELSSTLDRDKYNRLLRYVFLEDGLFVNAYLVKQGFAFNYIYQPYEFMKYFDFLEKQAKEAKLGIWSEKCNY